MIPNASEEIEIVVDPAALRRVDAETVGSGLGGIHEYENCIFGDADWEVAAATLEAELTEVAALDRISADPREFDEVAWEFERESLPLELGVSAASIALCAAGCATFASCRGHDDGIEGCDAAWILFAADVDRLELVVEAARAAGCGLDMDNGLVVAYGNSVMDTMALAHEVIARRDAFGRLPVTLDPDEVAAAIQEHAGY